MYFMNKRKNGDAHNQHRCSLKNQMRCESTWHTLTFPPSLFLLVTGRHVLDPTTGAGCKGKRGPGSQHSASGAPLVELIPHQ